MSASWKITVSVLALILAIVRGLSIIGGPTDVDLNQQETKDALQFAVEKTIAMKDTPFLRKMKKVEKAQQQVVVGMKYILTGEMATTNCTKADQDKVCVPQEDRESAIQMRCTFDMWKHPFADTYELMKIACVA